MQFYRFGLLLFVFMLLASCAQVGSLQGGKKDEEPPKIDSLRSSRPFNTDFKDKSVTLTFDEWIVLDNPQQKVSISPPLKKKPTIALKGKSVVFTFDKDEELLPNKTYRIQFSDAVKDLNERNPAKDLEYVFSTGSEIHKGSYDVFVNDLQSGKALEGIIVSIYESSEDSLFRKKLPVYIAKTNKDGLARLKYLKNGNYFLYALEDKNQNNLFDLATEKIAFLDSAITVGTSLGSSRLILSETVQPLAIKVKTFEFDGLLKLVFNNVVDKQDFKIQTSNSYSTLIEQDSVKIFYTPKPNEPDTFIIDYQTKRDTLISKKLSSKKAPSLKLLSPTIVSQQKTNEPLRLTFNLPISSMLSDSILLIEDTIQKTRVTPTLLIDSLNPTIVNFPYNWKDTVAYRLTLFPKALKSLYGNQLDTTLQFIFKTISTQQLSEYAITIDSLNANYQYIIKFLNSDGKELERKLVSGKNQFKTNYSNLIVAAYSIEITEDRNFNRRWDASDFSKKEQPEFIFKKNLNPLKPNWTVEQIIEFNKKLESDKKDIKARGKSTE